MKLIITLVFFLLDFNFYSLPCALIKIINLKRGKPKFF